MRSLLRSGAFTVGVLGVGVAACSPAESSPEVVLVGEAMQGPNKPGPIDPRVQASAPPAECMGSPDKPCKRYLLPLLGNPTGMLPLREKYIAAFGSACYMSADDISTFNCFYKTWQEACANAVKVSEVWGGVPYEKGHSCEPVGNGNYSLQVGADIAVKIFINYITAPRETPLIPINGTPTEVNGPYRNLPEPPPDKLKPGQSFWCANIDGMVQRQRILQMNRDAHGGNLRSDLAGFTWPCQENGVSKICVEPDLLEDPEKPIESVPQVHHVVPMKDQRGCSWGANSNKNAAVISSRLNRHLTNNYPPMDEVTRINQIPAYPP